MASQDIRLRLVIRRHGVPEVKLVWPCACSDNFTISQLLEQVNEVITLESGEWGLEDYAVELSDGKGGSFECLHFQPVGRILKDEDQVLIRSLLSHDLKCRRLSGRHQITANGSHLVDGVAFGRTRLRAPRDRPPVELPPRKRARVTFSTPDEEQQDSPTSLRGEEEQEEERAPLRLLLAGPHRPSHDENSVLDDDLSSLDEDDADFQVPDPDDDNDDHDDDDDDDDSDQYDDGDEDLLAEAEDLHRECRLLGETIFVAQDPVHQFAGNVTKTGTNPVQQAAQIDQNGHADEDDDGDDDDDEDYRENQAMDENNDDSDESDSNDGEETLDQGVDDLKEEIRLLRRDTEIIEEDPAAQSTPKPERLKSALKSNALEPQGGSDYVGLPNGDIIALLKATFPEVPIDFVQHKVKEMRGDVARVYLSLAASAKAQCSFDDFMDVALLGLPQAPPEKVSIEALTNRAPAKSKGPLIQVVEEAQHEGDAVIQRAGKSPTKKSVKIMEVVESNEEDEGNKKDGNSSSQHSSGDLAYSEFQPSATAEESSLNFGESDTRTAKQVVRENGVISKKRMREESSDDDETSSSEDEDDDDDDDYDDDYSKVGKKVRGRDSSSSEEESDSQSGQGAKLSRPHEATADADASSDVSSDDSSEDTSTSEDESSESEQESDSDFDPTSDSDSDADADDSSDGTPHEISSKLNSTVQAVRPSPKQQDSKPSSSSHLEEKNSQSSLAPRTRAQPVVAPGLGMSKTQKRNARRRKHKQMLQARTGTQAPTDISLDDLFARKQALLAAIASESDTHMSHSPAEAAQPLKPSIIEVVQEEATQPEQEKPPEAREGPVKSRSRLDTGAGRRLLFGALGIKTPKTKADEEKAKQALMKDVRPLQNPRLVEEVHPPKMAGPEDLDAWRDRIIYSAVECCYDDMELSEPPFPFVQRWDPQQRIDKMRKRKRRSENYNETSFVGDESRYYDAHDVSTAPAKKEKPAKEKSVIIKHHTEQTSHEAKEDNTPNDDDSHIDSQFTDLEDLPSLPNDLSSLPTLRLEMAQPGTVITWKQLLMSKATKWQPELVSITGLILSGSTDSTLRLILAKRDREKNEKMYDEETGERVYDKFEVPDLDETEEEEEEDLGFRFLPWAELIEPKILQNPLATIAATATATVEGPVPAAKFPKTTTGTILDVPVQVKSLAEAQGTAGDAAARGQVRDSLAFDDTMEVETQATHQSSTAMDEDDRLQGSLAAEADLMMEFETQENSEMASIQSGQQMPRFADSSFALDTIITENEEMPQSGIGGGDDTSRTPESGAAEAMDGIETAQSERPTSPDLPIVATQDLDGTAADLEADPEDCVGDSADDGGLYDVDDIMSKPMFSFVQEELPPREEPSKTFPDLGISSDQPTSGAGLPDFPLDDSVVDETTELPDPVPRLREGTPVSRNGVTQPSPASSSIASIHDILMSMAASQKPPMQASKMDTKGPPVAESKKSRGNFDYEKAMRAFDEGQESDDTIGDLFPNSTQPAEPTRFTKTDTHVFTSKSFESDGIHSARQSFAIPANAEVISISSSSPSPPTKKKKRVKKHEFCDDEWEPQDANPRRSVLPQGPGWKKKFHSPPEYPSTAPSVSASTATSSTFTKASGSRTSRRTGSQKMEGFYDESFSD